jgi:hypothetical protein
MQRGVEQRVSATDFFLYFLAFFRKIFINMFLTIFFQKINPDLGAVIIDAKLTRLAPRSRAIFYVSLTWLLTWHELGAVDLGINCYGTEL